MFFLKRKSLLNKIQCIQVSTLIGAFIGVFLILSTILNNYIEKNHKKYLKQLSHNVINDINYSIPMYKSYLMNLTEDQYIKEYYTTFEEASLAQFLLKNKDIFPYLSFIEKDGLEVYKLYNKILYNTLSDYKEQNFFISALKNPNKVEVSQIQYNEDMKQYVLYFSLHIRSYYGNKFRGILLATIPLSDFINTRIIDNNITAHIVTKNNHILYSSNKKMTENKELYNQNNKNLTYRSSIINEQTYLLLDYPYEVIDTQIYDILIMIGIVFLLVIFISIILLYKESKKLIEPINTLIRGIDNISKGHFTSKINIPQELELKPIAESFNKMSQELYISQSKVEQNKKELQKLNQSLELEISKQHKNLKDKDKILFQKAKLASMGEMIDAIVHQWRQPLSIISTIASGTLVKLDYNFDIERKELLKNSNRIMSQVKHLDETIDEFRHFFREDNNFEVLPIKNSIQSALRLINNNIIQNKVTINMDFEDELLIELIPNEFKHVVINLISNSIDAFSERQIEQPLIIIKAHKNNQQIELQIIDNAGGIREDILTKIFLANFTTKKMNKGTGIGLYIAKQILRKINATITAKNIILKDNGIGVQFTILFPTVSSS